MRLLLLLSALFLFGCSHHAVRAFIPKQCIGRIDITAFTKPCTPISDTLAICDGVEIHYACVRYKEKK